MKPEKRQIVLELSLTQWRNLCGMSAEDLRRPDEFICWLIWREARARDFARENLHINAKRDPNK